MKEKYYKHIEAMAEELAVMNDAIFDFDEKGYVEYKSSALLCDYIGEPCLLSTYLNYGSSDRDMYYEINCWLCKKANT